MKRFLIALVTGGMLAYFLDPNNGTRRRNIARDRLTSIAGRTSKQVSRQAAYRSGVAQGIGPHQHDNINPDDRTLRDRVESEVLRDPKFDKAPVNFNVVNGVVEVRGELPTQGDIDALVSRIKSIRDVKGVHNYLHLPNTPAPNKEEAIQASK
jgi:osmotically-inducible protein OsmY